MMIFFYLIKVELLDQVQISASAAQVSLRHCLHALFLQTIHHVVKGILVWQRSKCLQQREKKKELKSNIHSTFGHIVVSSKIVIE